MKRELDHQTADRLAQGRIDASDAPPGFEAVADLLATARLATSYEPDEAALRSTVRAMSGAAQAALGAAPSRTRPVRLKRSVKAAGALALALSLTGGLAAADVVPDHVEQQVRHRVAVVVDRVGLDVLLNAEAKVEARRPENHGDAVSRVAVETSLEGRAKGEAVSATARAEAGKPAGTQGQRPPGERQTPPRDRGEDASDHDKGTGNDDRTQGAPADKPAPARAESSELRCTGSTSAGKATIDCNWDASRSEKFAGYRLHRATRGGRTAVLETGDRSATRYTDGAVRSGERYSYVLEVLDAQGGVISRSQPANLACCDSASAPPRRRGETPPSCSSWGAGARTEPNCGRD